MYVNNRGQTSHAEYWTLHPNPAFDFDRSSVNRKDCSNRLMVFYCISGDGIT